MQGGIRPADRITHVDGESILELNLQEAVEKIRGPVGSTVKLTIERNGGKLSFTVIRDKIVLAEVITSVQDNVAVIKIIQFGDKTRREFTDIVNEAMSKGPDGFILDLRNNPGGLLNAAVDVSAHFLPKGALVVRIVSRDDERLESVLVHRGTIPNDLPMVVLVNAGSASASEIVAGALQDHGRATIVGQKTFGKGTVQEVVQFRSGESIKLTIAEWLTPDRRSIDKNGVVPDIELEDKGIGGRDEALLEAVRIIKAKSRRR